NIDVVRILERDHPTHVVISAPWLTLHDLKALISHFQHIKFVVLSHSNIGFLQADPGGVELFRKYARLARTYTNLQVGGNNHPFVHWFRAAYDETCVLLPNLYPTEKVMSKRWRGHHLKVGAFGAIRPEKNF